MPNIEQGRIVWAELPNSDGTQTKRRPAVVITPTDEIASGKSFMVVAATTKFSEPSPQDYVRLPWHRAREVRTQLRQPTVAVCTWLFVIQEADIHKYGGVVSPKVLVEILEIVKQRVAE